MQSLEISEEDQMMQINKEDSDNEDYQQENEPVAELSSPQKQLPASLAKSADPSASQFHVISGITEK